LNKSITLSPDKSEIWMRFPYSDGMVNRVRDLYGRRWNADEKVWAFPAKTLFANVVLKFGREMMFEISGDVVNMGKETVASVKKLDRTTLYPHQPDAIDFIHNRNGNCLLADDMGVGKTIEALWYIKEQPIIKKILVVSPASVLYKWQTEIATWLERESSVIKTGKQVLPNTDIWIISYSLLPNIVNRMVELKFDMVILDECFMGDTLVDTDKGKLKIADIVNNRLQVSVLSCNTEDNVVQLKPITNWIKKEIHEPLVRVKYGGGYIDCTASHPIWTEENGYVNAKEVSGKTLRILRKNIQYDSKGKYNSEILQSEMRTIKSPEETKGNFILARVESVEILKRGSRQQSRSSEEFNRFVYCLDVEDNHNFFANSTLVHNCHYISNRNAKRSNAVKLLNSNRTLFLSGTPFLNRPIELWNILDIMSPSGWGSYWQFAKRYCDMRVMNRYGRKFVDVSGASNLSELKERLSDVMIRRTRKEVLKDLPDLVRTTLPVELKSYSEYHRAVADLKQWLRENKGEDRKLTALTKLSYLRYLVGISKVDPAVELIKDILASDVNRKVVVYAHHKEVVDKLKEHLKEYGCETIVGEDSPQNRAATNDRFQNKDIPRVLVISSAGGEGIDLYRADSIVFVEREWNPSKEEQAEGRLHRIGQKNAVSAYYLVAKQTFDDHINYLISKKRGIIGEIMGIESDILNYIEKEAQ